MPPKGHSGSTEHRWWFSLETMNETSPPKKLFRSRTDRYIGGVAAGIANRFNIDPVFIRIGFVASLAFGGLGLIAYLVLLAVMPVEGSPSEPLPPLEPKRRNQMIGLAVLVGFIGLLTVSSGSTASWLFGFWPGTLFGVLFWTAAAIAAFWLLINGLIGSNHDEPAAPNPTAQTPSPQQHSTEVDVRAEDETAVIDTTAETVEIESSTFAESPTQIPLTAVMPTSGRRRGPDPLRASAPGAESDPKDENSFSKAPSIIGRAMLWFAVGLAALTLFGTLFVVSAGMTAVFGGVPMAALVIVLGSGMVFAALKGRRQLSMWLLTAAVAVTIPMAFISIADLRISGEYGDIEETPIWASDVPSDGYKLAAGAITIDLRNLDSDLRGKTLELPVKSGMGVTSVIVPDDVCIFGEIRGKTGVANFRGYERNGVNVDLLGTAPRPNKFNRIPAGMKAINLDASFKLGAFEVVDDSAWRHFGRGGSLDRKGSAANLAAQRRAKSACSDEAATRINSGGKKKSP